MLDVMIWRAERDAEAGAAQVIVVRMRVTVTVDALHSVFSVLGFATLTREGYATQPLRDVTRITRHINS